MKRLFEIVSRHKFLVLLVLGAVAITAYFLTKEEKPTYDTTLVKRGNVTQEVSVTGRVESESEVSLSFERSGRVSSEPRGVGTQVRKGDTVVRLDSKETEALRAQAMANLDFELVRLRELNKGTRQEDISISASRVESARLTLADAKLTLEDRLRNAIEVSSDSLFTKTDDFFDNPRTINLKFKIPIADSKLVSQIEATRLSLTAQLSALSTVNATALEASLSAHKEYFANLKNYFDDLALAANSVAISSATTQTSIDSWKADISLARTSLTTSQTALLTAEQSYRSANSALEIASSELALKKAGPTEETLSAQQAKISGMRAAISNYDAQIAKSLLIAPFAGVITKQDAKMGETVSPNVSVVTLMSSGVYKITANIPEVDLAKISTGDFARVTLDAYGSDEKFEATVDKIDPAETIIAGVSTYKITLHFKEEDARIRSGMTANIDISTDARTDVLYVPARTVQTKDNKKYIKIPNGLLTTEKEVTVGLRGSDGSIEIVTGLVEGEVIVTFEK